MSMSTLGRAALACMLFAAGNSAAQTTRGLLYVANNNSPGSVSVIDSATATLVATIPVGNAPTRLVTTPDNSEVFVSNSNSASVSVLSAVTNGTTLNQNVIAEIPVGITPEYLTVTPNGQQVYVANRDSNSVSVINVATNTLLATVTMPGSEPWSVAAAPNGNYVYVSYIGSNLVSVISTATLTDVADIQINSASRYVTVSPDSTRVYASQTYLNAVAVIDASTNKLIASVPAGYRTNVVAVTPDGTQVFSGNPGLGIDAPTGTIVSFNTATDLPIANIDLAPLTWQVVLSHDGSTVWTASSHSDSLYAIDVASESVVAQITVGTGPYWTTVSDPDGTVFVTNPPDGTVSVVDSATDTVIATVPTGPNPWSSIFVNGPVTTGPSPPQVTSASPTSVVPGNSYTLTVNGSGFEPGASLSLTPFPGGVTLSSLQFVSRLNSPPPPPRRPTPTWAPAA